MASTTVMNVEVVKLTPYGFKDGKDNYVNWSKTFKDADKVPVIPGRSFEMEMYIADSGKQYVNKIIRQMDTVVTVASNVLPVSHKVTGTAPSVRASVTPAVNSSLMSKDEWADKDRRISRQGCIQAAVQAVSGLSTVENLFENAEALAEKMLAFVNRK
jgi:hypothetical protein